MEEVLAAHPDVAECAVVGVDDALKGEVPLGLVVLKAGAAPRPGGAGGGARRAGPPADRPGRRRSRRRPSVKRLPKTRSGKIVRGTIKKIADGAPYTIPPTIDDPAILEEISADLAAIGYPRERPKRSGTGMQVPM